MKTNKYKTSFILTSFVMGILLLTTITMSVHAQSITLLSPNGGEVWTSGTVVEISWTGQELGSTLRLEFSPDGGNEWFFYGDVPSAPDGGIFPMFVPNYSTTNGLLKITDFINPVVKDSSDATFTVIIKPISLYQPATGSIVFANEPTYVNWLIYVPGISLLNAEISTDNGLTFVPVAQNINALMGYTYLVLSDTPAETCIFKLYNAADPSMFCLSTPFTILTVPVYTLTSPSGGEIVNVYSPLTINWTVENPFTEYCDLEYSTDNGENWITINNGNSQGNSGSYEWTTPNVNSEECMIRIRDLFAQTSNDTSPAFTIMPFPDTQPCMVTTDSLTNFNVIIWEKPVSDLIADFLVYKETDEANVYEVIDTVGYEEIAMVTDASSNPDIRPYRYKIGFTDADNRVFPAGDYHQTIHLTINQGVNLSWNLIWTPYIGFDFSSYKIMRKTDSGDYEQIATVSASFGSFTDLNAPTGEVNYMIKIDHPDGCDPATRDGVYASVYSNVASNSPVSLSDDKKPNFSIYPNPANKQFKISFGENITGKANLKISDPTGRVVYSEEISDVRPGQVHTVNCSSFNEGMYLLQMISGENRITKKIFIQH